MRENHLQRLHTPSPLLKSKSIQKIQIHKKDNYEAFSIYKEIFIFLIIYNILLDFSNLYHNIILQSYIIIRNPIITWGNLFKHKNY